MASSEPVLCKPVVELSRSETRFWQRLVRRGRTHEINGCTYRFAEFRDKDNIIIAHRLCDATPENPTGDILALLPEYAEGGGGGVRSVVNYVGTFHRNENCRHGQGGIVLEHTRVSRAMGRLQTGSYVNLWSLDGPSQTKKKRVRKNGADEPPSAPEAKKWKQLELPTH